MNVSIADCSVAPLGMGLGSLLLDTVSCPGVPRRHWLTERAGRWSAFAIKPSDWTTLTTCFDVKASSFTVAAAKTPVMGLMMAVPFWSGDALTQHYDELPFAILLPMVADHQLHLTQS